MNYEVDHKRLLEVCYRYLENPTKHCLESTEDNTEACIY